MSDTIICAHCGADLGSEAAALFHKCPELRMKQLEARVAALEAEVAALGRCNDNRREDVNSLINRVAHLEARAQMQRRCTRCGKPYSLLAFGADAYGVLCNACCEDVAARYGTQAQQAASEAEALSRDPDATLGALVRRMRDGWQLLRSGGEWRIYDGGFTVSGDEPEQALRAALGEEREE